MCSTLVDIVSIFQCLPQIASLSSAIIGLGPRKIRNSYIGIHSVTAMGIHREMFSNGIIPIQPLQVTICTLANWIIPNFHVE